MTDLILASKSPFRGMLMRNAGLDFVQEAADVDERAIEQAVLGSGITPEDLAMLLAEAKAQSLSAKRPDALVIGSDQTLSWEIKSPQGRRTWRKPDSACAARRPHTPTECRRRDRQRGETVWRQFRSRV